MRIPHETEQVLARALDEAATFFFTTASRAASKSKSRPDAGARKAVYAALRKCGMPITAIGYLLSVDHSTIAVMSSFANPDAVDAVYEAIKDMPGNRWHLPYKKPKRRKPGLKRNRRPRCPRCLQSELYLDTEASAFTVFCPTCDYEATPRWDADKRKKVRVPA